MASSFRAYLHRSTVVKKAYSGQAVGILLIFNGHIARVHDFYLRHWQKLSQSTMIISEAISRKRSLFFVTFEPYRRRIFRADFLRPGKNRCRNPKKTVFFRGLSAGPDCRPPRFGRPKKRKFEFFGCRKKSKHVRRRK